MFQEKSIEICILSRVKQITSPGWMHETSARTWCTGKTWKERVEREVGGGTGMGNTCKPMADSFQCMTKPTTIKKRKKNENVKMDSRGIKANILTVFLFSGLYDYKGFLAALFKNYLFLNLKFK